MDVDRRYAHGVQHRRDAARARRDRRRRPDDALRPTDGPASQYGVGAFNLLTAVNEGKAWRALATQLFDGMGSFGNGAAMRSAPIGAYFADDLDRVVAEARLASAVTHAHPEGIAGGIAVAVAAAHAQRTRMLDASIVDAVLARTPRG